MNTKEILQDLKTYSQYNSGFCDGSTRVLENDPPALKGVELELAHEVENRLAENDVCVVLDLGAMCGASVTVLGSFFKREIAAGKLRILATNKEDNFTPEKALAEAQRRLDKYPSINKWNQRVKDIKRKRGILAAVEFGQDKPILDDQRTIDFLMRNYHLVEFESGVDTVSLPQSLEKKGLSGVDIVHEHKGGLAHHSDQRGALRAVASVLKKGGLILTQEKLEAPFSFGGTEQLGLELDNSQLAANTGYLAYRKK